MSFQRSLVAIVTLICLIALTFDATVWGLKEYKVMMGFSSPSSMEKNSSIKAGAAGADAMSAPVRPDGRLMSQGEFQEWLARRDYYHGDIDYFVGKLTRDAWDKAYNDQCGTEDVRVALGGK